MSDLKVSSELIRQTDGAEVDTHQVQHNVFKITDIPTVMDSMGWCVAARFMRKWFNDPFFEMSKEQKINKADLSKVNSQHFVNNLEFDEWLMKYERVSNIIDAKLEEVRYVNMYNNFLGFYNNIFDALSPGLRQIISRLDGLGLVDHINNELLEGNKDYSTLSAMELDKKSQFNIIKFGSTFSEKAFDDLDDVYGALGSFIVKFALTNFSVEKDRLGFSIIKVNEIGLYVRDTYEFVNDGDDQLLGYWGWSGVIKPGPIDYFRRPLKIKRGNDEYFLVTNNSFVQYRNKVKPQCITGDFFVYSKVKLVPVDILMPISKTDVMEYKSKKGV